MAGQPRRKLPAVGEKMPYRSLFNVEPDALRERKLHPEIDRVGGPTHIGLPHVGAGLATAASLLLAAKGAADLGSGRPNVHVGDAAVRARRRNKSLCLAHIERKDGRGEACADGVVRPNGLIGAKVSRNTGPVCPGISQRAGRT